MDNEQLAALGAAATQVQRHADKASFIVSEIGRFGYGTVRAVAEEHARELRDTLAELRACQLVVRTEPSEADVDRAARAIHDTLENDDDSGGGGYKRAARAAIAAMVRT